MNKIFTFLAVSLTMCSLYAADPTNYDIPTAEIENLYKEIDLKEKTTQKNATEPLHHAKVYRDIVWTNIKGMSLTMNIHVPETGKESYPVLVIYHGGGWLINNNSIMEQPSNYIATQSEYIVCNVNYRLLGDNNNTTNINEIIEDAFGAMLWIKENIANYNGDPNKVAVTGDSAGGHLASSILNMGRNLSAEGFKLGNTAFMPSYMPNGKNINDVINEDLLKVQAAIISYGAFDMYATCKVGKFESEENFFWKMGGAKARGLFGSAYSVEANPELYQAVSPAYNIPKSNEYQLPPQLFTVGTNDNTTTPASIKAYITGLNAAGQTAELWIYEGRPHAFLDSGSNEFLGTSFEKDAIEAIKVMIEFLDKIFSE